MRTYDMGFGEEYEELNHSRGSIEKETGADIGRDEALKYEELLGKINSLLGMHFIGNFSFFSFFSFFTFFNSILQVF